MLINKTLFLCVLMNVSFFYSSDSKIIKCAQGPLEGRKEHTTFRNKPYYSFKGIPYADPCTDRRKFNVARLARPWTGVYDALDYRSPCPQMSISDLNIIGHEDCLYLNVFTPNASVGANLAVMVFFQAGLFQMGYADDDYYDPEFLVEKGVIVVTFNHRLGPLGFLSTMDGHAPGNVGLKDQVLVLKWVQQNIHYFGGDPKKVTLFGQSSGATSVHLHMLSPMSRGLFHACILMSGSALSWWSMSRDPQVDTFALGRILNIPTNDTKKLIDTLKNTPTKSILEAEAYIYEETATKDNPRKDLFPFSPSVEFDAGQEMFLPDDPWTIMRSGKVAEVPIIIGVTSKEAAVIGTDFATWDMLVFIVYHMCRILGVNDYQARDMLTYVQDFYLQKKSLHTYDAIDDDEDVDSLIQCLSDLAINVESIMTAKILTYRSSKNVYLYEFDYLSEFGMFKEIMRSDGSRPSHGDDLTYLFHTHMFEQKQIMNMRNQKMVDVMTKLWTNFAKYLDPTFVQDEDIYFTWKPLDTNNYYLKITANPTIEKNLFTANVKLWAMIFKKQLQEYYSIFS